MVDVSDKNFKNKIHEVNKVLSEIKADDIPQIIVRNKIDINDYDENDVITPLNSVAVSAKEGIGIETLKGLVSNHANRGLFRGKLFINFRNSKLRSECYRKAKIFEDTELNNGWLLNLTIGNNDLKKILFFEGVEIIESDTYLNTKL